MRVTFGAANLAPFNMVKSLVAALLVVAVVSAVQIAPVRANENQPLKILFPSWGLTLQEDGTGLFNTTFNFIRPDDVSLEIIYVPYEEALRRIVHGEAQCAYPIPKQAITVSLGRGSAVELIESAPVLVSKTYLFSRPGYRPLRRGDDLTDKMLIQILGENYHHNFKGMGAQYLNVHSETDKVRTLLAGRGHAMIGSMPDILYSFDLLDVALPPFDPSYNLLDYPNSITCRNSPATRVFIDKFDASVRARLADGSLKAFLVKEGVPADMVDAFLSGVSGDR